MRRFGRMRDFRAGLRKCLKDMWYWSADEIGGIYVRAKTAMTAPYVQGRTCYNRARGNKNRRLLGYTSFLVV